MPRWPTPLERFWSHVQKADGCWLWTGGKTGFGYGKIKWLGRERGAHSVSWELHNGPVPVGLSVLHKCDRPACVNPDHLFLGTHTDNMRDAIAKGRFKANRPPAAKGEANSQSRLSADNVAEIRSMCARGVEQQDVAELFGITQPTVSKIVNRRRWS